jgi:RNA polymerase sigma factor (sigma-70 family)
VARTPEHDRHDDVDQMVARAGSRDDTAVAGLLARFLPDVERYVRQQMGRALQARESPSDLVQSACREVLEGLAGGRFEYRGESEFRSWLFTTALRKVQQRGRFHAAERRSAAAEIAATASRAEQLFCTLRTPSRSAADREDRRRFAAAFAQLDDQQQNVIVWVHLDGQSHREVAQRLGVSEGNSRVMLARALSRLARLAAENPPES